MAGTIFDADKMFLRITFGEATSKKRGDCYELSINPTDGSPILRSRQTGKWFVLDWPEIIELAYNEGIDSGDPKLN